MSVTTVRAIDTIGVVVAEPAVLNQEVVAPFAGIVGYPNAALEVLHPTIADDRVGAETVLEPFADLVGTVVLVIALVVHGVQIEPLNAQVAA